MPGKKEEIDIASEIQEQPVPLSNKGEDGVIRLRSPAYQSAYTNSAQIGSTPFEFRLTFSEIREVEAGTLGVEEKITLVMSPQHAKAMLMLVYQNVKRWESDNGEISLPSGMMAAAKKSVKIPT